MWSGMDRRKFPRAQYKCTIYIRTEGSDRTISTRTENIGAGGICVILKEDLGLFKSVQLELDLENGQPGNIKCSGTVVWVVKKRDVRQKNHIDYDTGIEFADIDTENRERIAGIVEKVLKDAKE